MAPSAHGIWAKESAKSAKLVPGKAARHISVGLPPLAPKKIRRADSASFSFGLCRAFAETTNDPDVYAAAQIPPPSAPTPAGPPEQPTNLDADILQPFGIKLTWKGSVSQNTYFGIYRKLPSESAFTLIQTTRERSYEDTTLPAGVATVEYYVGAFRDPYQVNSTSLTLRFGPDGTTATTSLGLAA